MASASEAITGSIPAKETYTPRYIDVRTYMVSADKTFIADMILIKVLIDWN